MSSSCEPLKIISRQTWGANQSTSSTLYRTLIHTKLDCEVIIYGIEHKSYLKLMSWSLLHFTF